MLYVAKTIRRYRHYQKNMSLYGAKTIRRYHGYQEKQTALRG